MMDDYGYTIPSDKKGGQLVGMLETPIIPGPGGFIENPKGTEWCDKNEQFLEEITKMPEYQGLSSRISKLPKHE